MEIPSSIAALSPLLPSMQTVFQVFLLAIVAALTLSPLEGLFPAYRQNVFLRKGFFLDLWFWFLTPLLTRLITGIVLGVLLFALQHLSGNELSPAASLMTGFGPVSRQPAWLQCLEVLLVADFVDYWTHRGFHLGPFWKIHAIHHSADEMSWLSSSRVHPLNDLVTRAFQIIPIMVFGFSAVAVLNVIPYLSFYVMFLHSNIRWDFGPVFRWVLVSPAYHRWHHTSDEEGIDKNFAGIFPLWDVLFGTCHFPNRLPKKYGLCGEIIPETILGQLAFPFSSAKR